MALSNRTLTVWAASVFASIALVFAVLQFSVAQNRGAINQLTRYQNAVACVLTLPQTEEGRDSGLVAWCYREQKLDAPRLP